MMIAIIGWGSLIWKPESLPYEGYWQVGGPSLPLEFTRITSQRPLTLVLDPVNGVICPTRFSFSSRTNLPEAIDDLKQREGTSEENIGYLDLKQRRSSIQVYPQQLNVEAEVRRWCLEHQLDAAIWTAIPPNFEERAGNKFSVEAAIRYFKCLSKAEQESTLEYIRNTPPEINTPLRQQMFVEQLV